jgi:ribosomal protein S12 methylthiotransferase accessory factor
MSSNRIYRTTRARGSPLAIIFVGPSLPRDEASRILTADYRPPIRRGDLDRVPAGSTVAIIDGVFDQDLSVSPTEIRAALDRGIKVFGASSMGALRAVEVPGVHGVGKINEMYRSGAIDGDDEVAIVFDPRTLTPLCEPLVNVRHAVEQLAKPGSITRELATAIVRAARRLPYPQRSYHGILRAAGLADHCEASQLIRSLASYDLKREDAISLLEHLRSANIAPESVHPLPAVHDPNQDGRNIQRAGRDTIHCWEFGPPYPFQQLVEFLALSGSLSIYAVRALSRIGSLDSGWTGVDDGPSAELLSERLLAQTARAWHWATEEEVEASLADLGLLHEEVEAGLASHVEAERKAMALTRGRSDRFFRALAVELFLDDLALKREAARAVSLHWLADRGKHLYPSALRGDEERAAADKLCQALDVRDLREGIRQLNWWRIPEESVRLFMT